MYRNSYQRGMLTVFFSGGSKPLEIWDKQTKDGYIKRFLDQEIKTMVMEIRGTNISTTYIICPKGNQVLGIFMPFLVMIVKNLNKYFSFEVTVLDDTGTRRRFRVSNFQSTTQILPLCTVMPIGLSDGWNQIQFNLAEFTRRAYKKEFQEVQKLKINANIRLRRIYFTERLMSEDELPPAYKLYFPLQSKSSTKKALIQEKEPLKISSKTNLPTPVPVESPEVEVIKEPPLSTERTVEKTEIEKKPSVEKVPSAQKVGSAEKTTSEEKAPDAENAPAAEDVPAAERAPSTEGAPSAEGAPSTEGAPDTQDATSTEKAPSTDQAPDVATHPTDESTTGEAATDTAPESATETA